MYGNTLVILKWNYSTNMFNLLQCCYTFPGRCESAVWCFLYVNYFSRLRSNLQQDTIIPVLFWNKNIYWSNYYPRCAHTNAAPIEIKIKMQCFDPISLYNSLRRANITVKLCALLFLIAICHFCIYFHCIYALVHFKIQMHGNRHTNFWRRENANEHKESRRERERA